jgi:ATP-dependent RNA helicase DHX57
MVILKSKNSKTQELVTLPSFRLPPSHKQLASKATALEARHFAATFALFRVCSMRNIHMMLPPDYRDLWKGEFETLKRNDVKEGKAWMYEGDPFSALREREEAKAVGEKKKKARDQFKEQADSAPAPGGIVLALRNSGTSGADPGSHNILRGWTRAPKIEMGKRTRASIESLVREHTTWNIHDVKISEYQKRSIVNEFKTLGFRQSHIQEAVEECKDREETLEWLLIHVPEDDLPRWALPEGYVAGISMGSADLKREGTIKRLAEAGYSQELCKQVYDLSNDEGKAAVALQQVLLSNGSGYPIPELEASRNVDFSTDLSITTWEEEMTGLQSVFVDTYSRPSKDSIRIMLTPSNGRGNNSIENPVIQFRRSPKYPEEVPIITIHAALPAYIRLSMVKQALNHATEHLIGEPMLFFLVDWVEQHFYGIIEKPGKLREVLGAVSTTSEAQPIRRKRQRMPKHPKPISWTPDTVIRDEWINRQSDPKLQNMVKARRTLPAWGMRETIIDMVNSHQVTIISGETGSGKSTQSAQFILDDLYQNALGGCANIM